MRGGKSIHALSLQDYPLLTHKFSLIILTFSSNRTSLALVLLNQPVTLAWKLLNLVTSPVTVPLILANISRTSLNYYFVTYSMLSYQAGGGWVAETFLVCGAGGGTTCCLGFIIACGYSCLLVGILAVWMNSFSSYSYYYSAKLCLRPFGKTLGLVGRGTCYFWAWLNELLPTLLCSLPLDRVLATATIGVIAVGLTVISL